jgi:hypothetical protein
MNEYDRVELIVDKERYAKHGVRKGMNGWICHEQVYPDRWLVCFDQDKYFKKYPVITVKTEDLRVMGYEGI